MKRLTHLKSRLAALQNAPPDDADAPAAIEALNLEIEEAMREQLAHEKEMYRQAGERCLAHDHDPAGEFRV